MSAVFTRQQAAEYLHISTRTLARLTAGPKPQIAVTRIGGGVRFTQAALDRFIARCETPARAELPPRATRKPKKTAPVTEDAEGRVVFNLRPAPFMTPAEVGTR